MSFHYRIVVLADIHGNMQALEAVLADLEKDLPFDGVLVAGDIIVGPGQQQVLQRLVELGAVMIQGNNEQRIARMEAGTIPPYFYTAMQFSITRWAYENLDPNQRALVCNLPEQTVFHLPGADPIHIAHGSPRSVNELVLPDHCLPYYQKFFEMNSKPSPNQMDEIFDLMEEPVLVVGHTHLPWYESCGKKMVMNPGAVNFPLNGWVGAQYALLHWDGGQWKPEFRAIPYDLDAFKRLNKETGFLDTGILAKLFLEEVLCGKAISFDFFLQAQKLADEAGIGQLHYYPDEIWERAGCDFRPSL
jgi:predicted phosphodiesterase